MLILVCSRSFFYKNKINRIFLQNVENKEMPSATIKIGRKFVIFWEFYKEQVTCPQTLRSSELMNYN